MKILMIAPVPFFNDRGCSVRVYEEAMALQRRGHTVRIVAYHLGRDIEGVTIDRTPTIPWYQRIEAGPSWHRPYIDVLVAIKALLVQWTFKADVIHGHLHEGCLAGWLVSRLCGVPLLFDYQGSLTEEIEHYDFIRENGFMHKAFRLAESIINHLPDRIVVSGSSALKSLKRSKINLSKVQPLLDGIGTVAEPDPRTQEKIRARYDIPSDSRIVAYAGSLSAVERIDDMLSVAKRVVAQEPHALFLILGYPDVEKYQALADTLGIAKYVRFTGRVPHEDVIQYLDMADIAISTKREVEANAKLYFYMKSGKPIVAFDHPVNREALGDLGEYPADATVESCAQKVLEVLALPQSERAARGAALKERVQRDFSWDARALELEDTYHILKTSVEPPRDDTSWRYHLPALLLALAIGFVTAAPFWYFTTTPSYQGIVMMGADAEDHYLARIKEVDEGHLTAANTFLSNKDQPYFFPSGGELLSRFSGKILGLSVPQTEMFDKFFFPFCIALVLYFLGYTLAKSRGVGLLFAASVLLGDGTLLSGPHNWLRFMSGESPNLNFLAYTRPISPEVSGFTLFVGLTFLYRAAFAKTAHRLEYGVLGLIVGGAMYVSPFIFSFLGAVLFLSFVWRLVRHEYADSLTLFKAGVIALLMTIPFLYNYHALSTSAAYADSALRQGLVHTHTPHIGYWLPILLTLTIALWPRRYACARGLFVVSSLALLALVNQQVLTGAEVQPGHYHWYITVPLIFMTLSLYVGYWIEKIDVSFARKTLWGFTIALFFYIATVIQVRSYEAWLPTATAAQAYASILTTLNTLPGEQSIWADPALAMYIPIYTSHDSPGDGQLTNYLVSLDYLKKRLFLMYRLRDITGKEALSTMTAEKSDVSSQLYSTYWYMQTGSFLGMPDELLKSNAQMYAQTYASMSVAQLLSQVGATHIVWDTETDPTWQLDQVQGLKRVATSGRFVVYAVSN